MDKRFSWIFLAVSAAFFVFIVGLTGYRIEDSRRGNTALAGEQLRTLAGTAVSLRETAGGYAGPEFALGMREAYDAQPRLLLLSIHSAEEGILYLVARNKAYLKEPSPVVPEWRGTPSYQVSRGYEVLLSSSLGEGVSEPRLDALFLIMGREDLYGVLRDDLYLFLAFLLVSGVFILIVMSIAQEPSPSRPAREPAGSAQPVSRVRTELERAASSDQDLALVRVLLDDPPPASGARAVADSIAKALRESFPFHDLISETGEGSFTVLMPDTDIDSAVRSLDAFREKVSRSPIEGRIRTISVGVSSRGGRLIEEETLVEEAVVAAAKAAREGGDQVVGFRADPVKFRESLSGLRL